MSPRLHTDQLLSESIIMPTYHRDLPADMSALSPDMMCEQALKIYNTIVIENGEKPKYKYKDAFRLFNESVIRFEKVEQEVNRKESFQNYGKALYYLHECYRYGRGVKRNEARAKQLINRTIDDDLVLKISDEKTVQDALKNRDNAEKKLRISRRLVESADKNDGRRI